jgi:hypothetical protein
VLLLGLAACAPRFDRAPATIDGPRFLAVVSEPPEAVPGARVRLSAVLVDENGPRAAAPAWAFCAAPNPAAEPNTVSQACLLGDAGALRGIAAGVDPLTADAALPSDGCKLFGPEPLPPPAGQPPLRAADPDDTGGYYQPVRVAEAADPVAFGQVRLTCALPSAPASAVQEFRARYRANQNPGLPELALPGGATQVAAGEQVSLLATMSDADAEPYVAWDAAEGAIVDRVEALRLDWFTTQGALEFSTAAAAGGSAQNVWTAPDAAGTAHLWVVLRDDRGGASVRHLAVEVR